MDDQFLVTIPEFVIQEAKEKCFEIEVKTQKQFELEKRAYLQVEKQKLNDEFEQKIKKEEMEQKIKRSSAINKARLGKMEARNKAMKKIFSMAQYHIYTKINQDQGYYKNILKKLMLQGLIQLFEKQVRIRCLQKDSKIIESILPEVIKEFKQIVKTELETDMNLDLKIDENVYLKERKLDDHSKLSVDQYNLESEALPKNQEDTTCFGGVVLSNIEGNIICKNTLDGRIDMVYQESLPDIRQILFPRN
ncbi:hypothetical protein PPERSA_12558 [Pseudocohnilembus persalinus]|uniref:ATPase, V1/A1 complex, subunit E n=1 Tax=Pseudocohnilembus persalinus TaxID=266149 RepID=A0A0V0QCK0_PSEPJ|nr:hypothetical protein PPERSA_12558 [Pseudocohnilembus persalinus]|eukprot:KRW99882.1 hypothetical protein PPERSA_12558 [Pseudocohnilembus persalinus]